MRNIVCPGGQWCSAYVVGYAPVGCFNSMTYGHMYLRSLQLQCKFLHCFKGCGQPLLMKVVSGPHIYGYIFKRLSGVAVARTSIINSDVLHPFHNSSSIKYPQGFKWYALLYPKTPSLATFCTPSSEAPLKYDPSQQQLFNGT